MKNVRCLWSVAILVLALAACQAWAATPLNTPYGLAVGAKGNLYVANYGGSEVLVYSPTYVQQTKKNITTGVSAPTGVAFDSLGNLYVSNAAPASLTEYDSTGKQIATITASLVDPVSIAIDAMDDVWVLDGPQIIRMYAPDGTLVNVNSAVLAGDITSSIAVHKRFWAGGTTTVFAIGVAAFPLTNYGGFEETLANPTTAVTFDDASNLYACGSNGSVFVFNPFANQTVTSLTVGFAATGAVVDTKRQRIYLSSSALNEIAVYSIASANFGTLLHTIK